MRKLLTLGWLCIMAAGARGATVGNEIFLLESGPGGGTQATPHVAFGKGVYLVVWREGWHGKGGNARIYAARVAPDGKVLDGGGIAVAPARQGVQTRPRVAFGGGGFFVVWQDLRNGKDYDVLGARIRADGKVLDAEPVKVAAGPRTQALPDLASDGSAFVVVWQGLQAEETRYRGFARRVGADGRAGPAFASRASPQPKIAWGGQHYLVAYGTKNLDSLRLTSDGKPADPGRKPWDGSVVRGSKHPDFSLVALPKRGWLVVNHRSPPDPWGWGGPGGIRCYLMTPDGKRDPSLEPHVKQDRGGNWSKLANWLDVGGRKRTTWPYGTSACAWDGEHAVVVWQRHHITGPKKSTFTNCDLMAARVDGWKPVDVEPFAVAAGPEEERHPALASDGQGGLLCAYEKYCKDRTVRVVARMVRTGP